ncbi:MAG: ACT domain-containing protein [Clostridia bacterium]|nr:ACT domain-containing protein [Clostridia bacterium]
MKKAIITVLGKDRVGIIHGVAHVLAEKNVNILDISQTILSDVFTMMMLVDVENSTVDFTVLSAQLDEVGKELGLEIRIQLEEIFQAMHRI